MSATRDPETGLCRRGTSNRDKRGSTEARRRRKEWLVLTFRADMDAVIVPRVQVYNNDPPVDVVAEVPLGRGVLACRCYRCGTLLVRDTLTVDRIIPECKGGTYRRNNIRPACHRCNSETGAPLANGKQHVAAKKRAQKTTKKVAVKPVLELVPRAADDG